MPVRVDGDLFDAARVAGVALSRSAAQQISHWARIGREFEFSPGVSQRDIDRVLSGDGSYDELGEREQAVVRSAWTDRMTELRAALDLADEFTAAGRSWSEADHAGNVVIREPPRR
jgi:hypothetical protein